MLGEHAKQAPFILATSMNETIKESQQYQLKEMKRSFTIRRESFAKRSVKISQFARKQNLLAVIKIADVGGKQTATIFGQHEKGGIKSVRQGRNLSIPSQYVQPVKSRVVAKGKRPRNMPRAYKVQSGGREFLFVRIGKGKNSRSELAYSLKPQVMLAPRLDMQVNVGHIISTRFNHHFSAAYDKALATAR